MNPYISGLETSLKLEHVGQKAYNLMVLIKEGIPVPPGCVITKQAHCYFQVNNSLPKELEAGLDKALLGFTSDLLIVRSSAIGEDSGTHSFAGQFDSFVCDNNKLSVTEALKKCWNSLSNDRAKAYQSAMGMELTEMGVVLQEFVEGDYSGVLFTSAPHDATQMYCEYVEGRGEQLVSGAITPFFFSVQKKDGLKPATVVPFKTDALIHAGLRLEKHYKTPVDIE